MKKYKKEIIKLTANEVLLSIFDLALPFFEADRIYRISARKYREERSFERSNYIERIKYLKRQGYIESFVEGKEKYIEITPKGIQKVEMHNINNIKIKRPKQWDGNWRVVIFDIDEKHKYSRDIFRLKLVSLGFQKVQESVYVYPFECTDEVSAPTWPNINNKLPFSNSMTQTLK